MYTWCDLTRKKKNIEPDVDVASTSRINRYEEFLEDLKHDRSLWFVIFFGIVLAYLLLNQGGSVDLFRSPQYAFRAFAFGGLVLFSIIDHARIRAGLTLINFRGILPVSLILLIATSIIITIRPIETIEEAMNIGAYGSMAFLCYTYINSLKRLRQLIEVILAAGFLIAFHGLFIFYGALWGRGETTPLASLFYWHNPCAGFLLLIWPVMLAQFYSLRKGLQTFLILYIFYFTFTAFGLTLSRGGWLSGLIPFLLIPFILSRKRVMVNWRPLALVGLYFLSVIPFILKYRGRFFQPIIDRWNQMRPDDYSVVGRLEFWDIAWRVFVKHPWIGIGFNTFGYYYVHFQTDPQYYTKDPHSLYLRFLVEGGFIGAIFIIAILFVVLRLILKTLKVAPGKMLTVYRIGLLGGIVGELAHMGLDFDWTFPVIPMLLVCQIALVARTFSYPEADRELPVDQWEPEDTGPPPDTTGDDSPRPGWFLKRVFVWQSVAFILFLVNTMGFVSMSIYEKGKELVDNQAMLAFNKAQEQMSQAEREMVRSRTQELPDFGMLRGQAQSEIVQEGMRYWQLSLNYNPWNWYPLKDLLTAHYYGALDLYQNGADLDLERIVTPGLEYGNRLLNVTPFRPASYFFMGQMEILAGRLKNDDALKEQGFEKLLHSIELDPVNIPSYYFSIAQYYYDDLDNPAEALNYLDTIERIFVPRHDNGDIDFSGLKGKSGARLDWQYITKTLRDSWQHKAWILIEQERYEEALVSLYNGYNTPPGTGEVEQAKREIQPDQMVLDRIIRDVAPEIAELDEDSEEYLDARNRIEDEIVVYQTDIFYRRLQLPFLLKISQVYRQLGDWENMYLRVSQAINIVEDLHLSGSPESVEAYNLYYEARGHMRELGLLEENTVESGDLTDEIS